LNFSSSIRSLFSDSMIMFLTVLSWNSISSGLSLPLSCRCPNLVNLFISSFAQPVTSSVKRFMQKSMSLLYLMSDVGPQTSWSCSPTYPGRPGVWGYRLAHSAWLPRLFTYRPGVWGYRRTARCCCLLTYRPGVWDYRPLARAAATAQTPAPGDPGSPWGAGEAPGGPGLAYTGRTLFWYKKRTQLAHAGHYRGTLHQDERTWWSLGWEAFGRTNDDGLTDKIETIDFYYDYFWSETRSTTRQKRDRTTNLDIILRHSSRIPTRETTILQLTWTVTIARAGGGLSAFETTLSLLSSVDNCVPVIFAVRR